MHLWLILTIIGQLLNSIVALIDKFLVSSKKVPRPSLYVFYTGVLVIFSIFLYVFEFLLGYFGINSGLPSFSNVSFPDVYTISHSFLAAAFFLSGLYFLFKSLVTADASDVFPVVGSISAFFVLFLRYLYFGITLKPEFFIGFIFLVTGTLFVSHFRFDRRTFFTTLAASFLLASQSVSLKKIFDDVGFDNGFFWYSLTIIILSVCMLFIGSIRKSIHQHRSSHNVKKTDKIIVIGKILAGIAGLALTKAIALGDVAIVQAMGGLQFLFLFLFALFFGKITHKDLGENVTRKDIFQKAISVAFILIGFVLLFI